MREANDRRFWENYLGLYDDGNGDSFWTTWYEESETFWRHSRP